MTSWISISEAELILNRPFEWIEHRMVPADWDPSPPVNKSWFFYEKSDWKVSDAKLFFNRDSMVRMRAEITALHKKHLFG
jgi:hypothetical protein